MKNILEHNFNLTDFFKLSFSTYLKTWKASMAFAFAQTLSALVFLVGAAAIGYAIFQGEVGLNQFIAQKNVALLSMLAIGAVIAILVYAAVSTLLQTAYTIYINAKLHDKPLTLSESFKKAVAKSPLVFAYTFAYSFLMIAVIALVVGAFAGAMSLLSRSGNNSLLMVLLTAFGILVGIILYIVLIYIGLRLMFTTVNLSLTDEDIVSSMRRSVTMTDGKLLRLIGYLVVIGFAIGGISVIYSIPLTGIATIGQLAAAQLEQPILMAVIYIVRYAIEIFLSTTLGYFVFIYLVAVYNNWSRKSHD
jgi:glycerophosphoryl diester phosphodiesterase